MATADHLLPVWPFLPNWRQGVLERLSWGTVVMTSETGSEQRFSSRISPRRAFEVTFNPVANVRTFFDLFVSRLGGQEMMVPLWHDRHKLTSAVATGANRINCVTAYGEFMPGGMAILIGADPWSHKTVRINTVDGAGFTLVGVTDFPWPKGGLVLPLRRSRLDEAPTLSNLTGRVGEANMRFVLNQANDLPDNGAWTGFEYEGAPVMTTPGDWSAALDMEFSRIMETEDNGTGLAFIRDIAERAFRTKKHTWHLRGRESNWQFRQFLYRQAGRRVPVWMPSGNDDMAVTVRANAGATNVQVGRVGLTYVGGPQPGRDRFLAKTADGFQARQIASLGAPALPSYERLNVAALTYPLPIGTNLQFLEMMRADGDDIELMHHTDTEGMTECSINYRSFNNARVPATPIITPIPNGTALPIGCGIGDADEDGSCYPSLFPGYYYELFAYRYLGNPSPDWGGYAGSGGPGITRISFNMDATVEGVTLPAGDQLNGQIGTGNMGYGGKSFIRYEIIDDKTFRFLFYFDPAGMDMDIFILQFGAGANPGFGAYSLTGRSWFTPVGHLVKDSLPVGSVGLIDWHPVSL